MVHLIFQPNFANNFCYTLVNIIFHPFLSQNFPTLLFQSIFQHNFPENLFTKNVHIILHQVFHLILTLKSYTQFFYTLCQSISPTLLLYHLNTASQILYTESLSSAIQIEKRKVMHGVAVGGEKNSCTWETLNFSICEHPSTHTNQLNGKKKYVTLGMFLVT